MIAWVGKLFLRLFQILFIGLVYTLPRLQNNSKTMTRAGDIFRA